MTEVQKVILEIFKEIDKICRDNNIKYYAIGGTCIGAVRHQGFIPWDDDLDIAIPIEDYDRFLDIAEKTLPDHLKVYTNKNIRHYTNLFNKIIDERTTFIENSQIKYPDTYKGVFVDIMPLCGLPADPKQRQKFIKRLKRYSALNILRRDHKSSWKRRIGSLFGWVLSVLPYNYFSEKIYKLYRSYPLNEAEYTGYVWHSDSVDRLTFPKEFFKEAVFMPFEDASISCPADYHDYLTQQFGDYMVIPPETEQVTHNGIVDLEKSYEWYQRNKAYKIDN
ncbi:MAG: LicD family protein [Roseburia sp.]|nr:LicD family protein [Roseburia sp.]